MVLVVSYEGKQLLICTSYVRTSVGSILPMQESRDPFPPFFFALSNLIFESPPTGFSPLFRRSRVSEFESAFPRMPYRVLFELTYFSEAFARTAKTPIVGVEKRGGGGEKSGRKSGGSRRERCESSTSGRVPPWLVVELFVPSVRMICSYRRATAIRGKEWLIFQRNCRFLPPSFFLFLFAPPAAVSLERIIPRYELGIYNYTGAVIGFPSFFPALLLSHTLALLFRKTSLSSAFLFISESRLIRAPARPTEKFPIIHRDRLNEHGRCPAKGKSESASLSPDIALTGVTIVTPRPRAKWPILLK